MTEIPTEVVPQQSMVRDTNVLDVEKRTMELRIALECKKSSLSHCTRLSPGTSYYIYTIFIQNT
jgi:hypothetical protein